MQLNWRLMLNLYRRNNRLFVNGMGVQHQLASTEEGGGRLGMKRG